MSIIRAIVINMLFLFDFYFLKAIFSNFLASSIVVNLQHIFLNYLKLFIKIKKCFFATVQKNTFHKLLSEAPLGTSYLAVV